MTAVRCAPKGRRGHLDLLAPRETIISGFYSWGHDSQNFEARNGDLHAKSMFSGSYSRLGNAIANRSRLYATFFAVDPHAEFEAPAPRLRPSKTVL